MLRRKFQPKSTTQNHNQRRRLLGNYDFRPLLVTAILTSGSWLPILPILAASPSAGTVIDNQATGSFVDSADSTTKQIESNVVKVTVAEVAGITVTASSVPSEAPSGVSGAGSRQGNGVINSGDVVYYDFTLTNVGNDPTQFFLPGAPSSITGGTLQGLMQIIEVDPDGSGATAPTALTVNIPSSGDRTGNLLGANGSIPVDGTVKIRVPIKVTATNTGDTVVVVLGDTPVPPNTNNQNQPYTAGNKDVYTLDNPDGTAGEAAGTPLNGDATNRRQEASASQSLTLTIPLGGDISGTVFEDVNYGGGAGRPLSTAGTSPRPNAIVELYKSDGTFVNTITTGTDGKYKFTVASGDYIVRVVNSTVTSSRTGYVAGLLPVQTFRTDASTGTVTLVSDRVGGEIPNEEDAPARSTTQTLSNLNALASKEVQSIAPVKVGVNDLSNVDFGFNFDTIVSTNDTGQGSLRQFITNSNALSNTGLAQVGQTAGKEVSIFMISDGAARPGLRTGLTSQFSGGVAIITLNNTGLSISDANTTIDGTRQTAVTGNTNAAVNEVTTGAEILVKMAGTTTGPVFTVTGGNTLINSISIDGPNSVASNAPASDAAVVFSGTNVSGSIIQNSTIFDSGNAGISLRGSAASVQILDNIIRGSGAGNNVAAGIEFTGNSSITVSRNQILANAGYGIDMLTAASSNNTISNNLIKGNGIGNNNQLSGIGIRAGSNNNTISQNTITGNKGDGIVGVTSGTGNTITQNSIFANGELGIDLNFSTNTSTAGDGVSLNDLNDADAGANGLLNFPILKTATISGSNLILTGFARPGSVIELFVADPDSSGFGEGKTYLVTRTEGSTQDTDSNTGIYVGLINSFDQGTDNTNSFRFSIPLSQLPGVSANIKLTATATLSSSTSEFSGNVTVVGSKPELLLVKRITAINGNTTQNPNDGTALNTFVNDPSTADDNSYWPARSTYLKGAYEGGKVKPGDEVEYTIYFLNTGAGAKNVSLCDRIPDNMTFVPTGYNSASPHPTESGASTDTGIGFALDGTTLPTNSTVYLTNENDSDRGYYYEPNNSNTPVSCKQLDATGNVISSGSAANTNGAVVVDIVKGTGAASELPAATEAGNPANSYGFIRFKAKVK